ncbi:DNA repair protein RadC [Ferrovum sp.]|uniref:RadC family protein n=1 Tax=Ferrovum sp. TaxID=2609467 RepID=UPI00262E317B|nr:DNA repair protein RadC [Ferrovum sp.]
MKVQNETEASYAIRHKGGIFDESAADKALAAAKLRDDETIAAALEILERRIRKCEFTASSPEHVKNFLTLKLAETEHEVFCVLYLNSQNQIICHEELFRGTLNQTAVYPREVVKRALHHNANAIILTHNHPSGMCEASSADRSLTDMLKKALALIDVKVLDHIIVGQMNTLSFVERGYL